MTLARMKGAFKLVPYMEELKTNKRQAVPIVADEAGGQSRVRAEYNSSTTTGTERSAFADLEAEEHFEASWDLGKDESHMFSKESRAQV